MTTAFEKSLVRNNIFEQNRKLSEDLRALQTKDVRADSVGEFAPEAGAMGLIEFDDGTVIDENGIHSNANLVDVNWWLPLNLANDSVTSIRAVVYDGSEYVYVAGQMSSIGGLPILTGYGVARYSLITRNWEVIGQMNGMVYALTYFSGVVYAGGAFTAIDQVGGYNRIARFTSTWGSPLGAGANSGAVLGLASGASGVFLVGSFGSVDSVANTARVAKFNGTVFSALGTGLAGTDGQAVVIAGSDVWVGGNYTGAGGVANTAYGARWDGSVWNSVGVFNGQVKALAYDTDSARVYVGGAFTTIDTVAFVRVAKNVGGVWVALGDLNGDVYALQVYNGTIIAGGAFTNAGDDPLADRVAIFNGEFFEALSNAGGASGLDGIVYSLLVLANGSIIAGGSFNFAGSIQCQSVAIYCKSLSDAIDIIASLFELYAGTGYITWTPVHQRAGTSYTNFPVTIIAKYKIIGNNSLHWEIVYQQNAAPGGTGNQTFTLPATSISVCLGQAWNANTNVSQTVRVDSNTSLCILAKYDGTVEVTANHIYVASGLMQIS